jgi:hypothetical protein
MQRRVYYRRAAKQFLAGTRFKAPCEMVAASLKSLEEWTDLLNFERDLDQKKRVQRLNTAKSHGSNLWRNSSRIAP